MPTSQIPERLVLLRRSTLVTDADLVAAALAYKAQQVEDVGPAHRVLPFDVVFSPNPDVQLGPTEMPFEFVDDDADVPGAGGYHTPTFARVLLKPYADQGIPFFSKDGAVVAGSHETNEARGDVFTNRWVDVDDYTSQIEELSDRVEGDTYEKTVTLPDGSTKVVPVSNFLLPHGFFVGAPIGSPRDFLGTLPTDASATPRDMTPGGYISYRSNGRIRQDFAVHIARRHAPPGTSIVRSRVDPNVVHVFGSAMPAWKRDLKLHKGGRLARRLGHGTTR